MRASNLFGRDAEKILIKANQHRQYPNREHPSTSAKAGDFIQRTQEPIERQTPTIADKLALRCCLVLP